MSGVLDSRFRAAARRSARSEMDRVVLPFGRASSSRALHREDETGDEANRLRLEYAAVHGGRGWVTIGVVTNPSIAVDAADGDKGR